MKDNQTRLVEGFQPKTILQKGYQPVPQNGFQPTKSTAQNPPSGGSSIQPPPPKSEK